jgi:hypothetical protein
MLWGALNSRGSFNTLEGTVAFLSRRAEGTPNSYRGNESVEVFDEERAGSMNNVSKPPRSARRCLRAGIIAGLGGLLSACAAGAPDIPAPRPIVIYSGARLRADPDSMKAVNAWVTREQDNIVNDPGFFVGFNLAVEEVYPWEGLEFLGNDTVNYRIDPRASDARLVFEIYAHQHLMARMGRQEEWLPEAPTARGYDLERAILSRVADAWLLGRTTFDTQPYGPLDELIYAKDAGFLDAFIFTARPEEFAEARALWARENPDAAERYRSWFVKTFNREPPGLRAG